MAPNPSRAAGLRAAYDAARGASGARPVAFVWAACSLRGGPDREQAEARAIGALIRSANPVDAGREIVACFLAGPIDTAELVDDNAAVAALEGSALDETGKTADGDPQAVAQFPVPGQRDDDARPQRVGDRSLRPGSDDDARSVSEIETATRVIAGAVRRRATLSALGVEARGTLRSLAYSILRRSRTVALRLDGLASSLHDAVLAAGTEPRQRSREDEELLDQLMMRRADAATINKALQLSADYEIASRSGFRGDRDSFIRHGLDNFTNA